MRSGIVVAVSLFALGALTTNAMVVAPSAFAASKTKSISSTLETWYRQTGRPALEAFLADDQRFREVTASSAPRVARQDCNHFKLDVLAAADGKLPPETTLAFDYRYYLLAAAKSFTECMTGLDATDAVEVADGAQGGALAVRAAVTIINGTGSGKVVAVPPSTTNLQPSLPASLLVPQCYADFKILEVAIGAYNAHNHVAPAPPAPWSASTYSENFGPLLSSKAGGPWMRQPPQTTHYVIEYDSSGNVWVEPPGQYDTSYDPAQGSFTACAAVAR
ncbi:MAG: hypothetical protein ACLPYY_02075 [Acidimicrobiales bacterium]